MRIKKNREELFSIKIVFNKNLYVFMGRLLFNIKLCLYENYGVLEIIKMKIKVNVVVVIFFLIVFWLGV